MSKNKLSTNTPGICGNCGGDYGIHHFETDQCPLGGIESHAIPQKWESTHFINDDFKRLQEAAPKLLEALRFYSNISDYKSPLTVSMGKL